MISLNIQPIEKFVQDNQTPLDVAEIFPTIQGEGPYTGERAVFVRMAGCNLQCSLCDTDYTSNRRLMTTAQITEEIDFAFSKMNAKVRSLFVVITGGEPLRQNIGPLINQIIQQKMHSGVNIQIETNGTLFRENLPWFSSALSVVCSPKTPKIDLNLVGRITAYKYVMRADEMDWDDGLPLAVLGTDVRPCRPPFRFNGVVYINPADEQDEEKNKANLQACIESCRRFGHRLGLQMHKMIGVP